MKKTIYLIIILVILASFYEMGVLSSSSFKLNLPPNLPTYTTKIQDIAPDVGGYGYSYTATAYSGLLVTASGITNPVVNLEAYLQGSSIPLPKVSSQDIPPNAHGAVNLKTYVQSNQGVRNYQLYAYKYDIKINDYRPIHVNKNIPGKYCSFKCEGYGCNLMEEKTAYGALYTTFDFSWDTTKCDNKKFMINVTGYDNYPNDISGFNYNNDTIFLNLTNPNPPCIDECFLFNSQLLNTIYIKIKSWVT